MKKTNRRAKPNAPRANASRGNAGAKRDKLTPTPAHGPLDPLLPPPYDRMTAAEMDAVSAEFDKEILEEDLKPLTPRMKALDDAMRGRGRPRIGKGAKRINLTMELDLLRRVDSMAARSGKSRSQIIARGVMDLLSKGARP